MEYEGVSFRLPHGTYYTPDFVIWEGNAIVLVVECKGSYRLHSAGASHEKVKSFIVAYPDIPFRYMRKTKEGWRSIGANGA